MKINGPGQISNISKAKNTGKSGGDDGFSKLLDEASNEKDVHSTGGVGRINSINFVPLVDGDERGKRRKKLIDETDDLLDELGKIRDALLMGNLSVERLQIIRAKIDKMEADCEDPALNEIIEEAKIRAAVELAKLGF